MSLKRSCSRALTRTPAAPRAGSRARFSCLSRCAQDGHGQLTITDPLVLYRHYVDSGRIRADEAQYRAAIEFQKLYYRVKDYMPQQDFKRQIEKLALLLEDVEEERKTVWYSPERKTLALIKTLTEEDEIRRIDAPQGLLIHGEVGKSMLMDMFAASLPHISKRRWHYHSFMLSIYSRLHRESQRYRQGKYMPKSALKRRITLQDEYVLLKIAEEIVDESAILLLDEFMLPDIAAAKIVQTLFTFIFKMGGVLVATSNRLPKELYSADFNKSQFGSFYDILQSRCVSYDMRSGNDWRHILCEESEPGTIKRYWVQGKDDDRDWTDTLNLVCGTQDFETEGEPAELTVYGRALNVPWHKDGVAKFSFGELCDVPLAGADFITLASTYHTLILDGVPALPMVKKNQARRLITLLDALYECRVKLIVRAESEPEDLFFPDAKTVDADGKDDSIELEMYSEVDLDLSSPYRPNAASYTDTENAYNSHPTEAGVKPKDFTRVAAFTGEDEMFAYKRAISRLKEMTGSDAWWASPDWMPLDPAMRMWEHEAEKPSDERDERDESAERASTPASPPRDAVPPRFSFVHFWSTAAWGDGKNRDESTRRWMRGADAFRKD